MHVCAYVCMCMCACMCVHVHVCACMCVHVHVCARAEEPTSNVGMHADIEVVAS